MVFGEEGKAFIQNLYLIKGHGQQKLTATTDFSGKGSSPISSSSFYL